MSNAVVARDAGQRISKALSHHFGVVVRLQRQPALGIDAKESPQSCINGLGQRVLTDP